MSSPSRSSSHRLLYRGALSLPDSYLLLDGLTFSARINDDNGLNNLLENPLALALESMRGRPSLRFMGVTSLKDVHLDNSGDIVLDIHPDVTLSRIYFENMFCLPTSSSDTLGVRIALGDSAGPETTQIIVFTSTSSNTDDPKQTPKCILSVARITPVPIAKPRLPRPDDPTPRKPPLVPFANVKPHDLRRVASLNASDALLRKRQKSANGSVIANLGSDVRVGQANDNGIFKIPPIPDKTIKATGREGNDKGKGKAVSAKEENDGLGAGADVKGNAKRKVENKGKRKRENDEGAEVEESPLERENKNRIKQATVHQLANSPVTKAHPEFKEVFNHVYYGVGFAMRTDMKVRPIDQKTMERLVLMHVGMYTGRPTSTSGLQEQPTLITEPEPGGIP